MAAERITTELSQRKWGQGLLARLETSDDAPRWNVLGTIGNTVSTVFVVLAKRTGRDATH